MDRSASRLALTILMRCGLLGNGRCTRVCLLKCCLVVLELATQLRHHVLRRRDQPCVDEVSRPVVEVWALLSRGGGSCDLWKGFL